MLQQKVFLKKQKSVSPLVATILLIVIAVILVVVVLTWGTDFVGDSLEETKIFYQESNLTGFITSQGNINNFITIANNHSRESISFIGYRIITSTGHQHFHLLNNDFYLEEKITINPRQSSTIRVHCLPESSFSLDLLLEDNSFVRVNVNVRDYSFNLCSIYDGLVLAYDMKTIDEDILIDISGNNHDGTINGGVTQTQNGLLFNGVDGCVDIAGSPELLFGVDNFTIIAKIKHVSPVGSEHRGIFGNHGGTAQGRFHFYLENGSGRLRFIDYVTFTDSTTSLANNNWNLISLVRNNNDAQFFVNSLRDNEENTYFFEKNYTFSVYRIGLRDGLRAFNGEMGFLKIYNRALTQEEIKIIYDLGKYS